jgi:hypothetical protein
MLREAARLPTLLVHMRSIPTSSSEVGWDARVLARCDEMPPLVASIIEPCWTSDFSPGRQRSIASRAEAMAPSDRSERPTKVQQLRVLKRGRQDRDRAVVSVWR